jgi:cytochrome c oxidase assembly protein subunit 15
MQSVRIAIPILDATPVWLRRFTKLVAASTLFLIFAGAMVTSTGSGLSVPDWPNSYGWFMFSFPLKYMVGGIFYEHGHRLIASTVGLLTVIQAIWLQRREPKRFVRILGWCSLAAVIAQGILGGVTVLLLLPKSISVAHAGLAEIFFCINVSIAFFTSRAYSTVRSVEKGDAPVRSTAALVALVYAQILIGALMRHLGAGLAVRDIFAVGPSIVNLLHRLGGVIVGIAIIAMAFALRRYETNHPLRVVANFLVVFVSAQIMLGVYTVWSGKQPYITSLHVMTGALTLGATVVLALTARTVAWKEHHAAMPVEVAA